MVGFYGLLSLTVTVLNMFFGPGAPATRLAILRPQAGDVLVISLPNPTDARVEAASLGALDTLNTLGLEKLVPVIVKSNDVDITVLTPEELERVGLRKI